LAWNWGWEAMESVGRKLLAMGVRGWLVVLKFRENG